MADDVSRFYDGLAADYDRILVDWEASVARQGPALAALLGQLGVRPPAPVLDCTCGIGTQALGLAAAGFATSASDLSAAAVERAGREAAARGLQLATAVADVRALRATWPGPFAAVAALDNAVAHLATPAELTAALREMAGVLRPGGRLLVSVRPYEAVAAARPDGTPVIVHDTPSGRVATFQLWEWDADGGGYAMELVVLREQDGRWNGAGHRTRLRAWRRPELEDALQAAGLADATWLEPAASGFYQPIVTAVRPG